MISSGGGVLHRQHFSAFGISDNPTWQSSNPAVRRVRRGYTGHEHDPETGLVNMGARLYDAVTKRFLTPDPIVQAPGWTQSWNRYSYVFNNPMGWVDPTGLQAKEAGDVGHEDGASSGRCDHCTIPEVWIWGDLNAPDSKSSTNSESNPGYTIDDFYPATNPSDIPASSPAPLVSQGPPSIEQGPEGQLISKILEDAQRDPECELASCYPEPTLLLELAEKQAASIAEREAALQKERRDNRQFENPHGHSTEPVSFVDLAGVGLGRGVVGAGRAVAAERVVVGEGASLANITAQEARRIQNAATRIGRPISLVGSRASGRAGAFSDWDYIIEGATSRARHSVVRSLPGAADASSRIPSAVDILSGPLDTARPFITFLP